MMLQCSQEEKAVEVLITAQKYKEASAQLPTDPENLSVLLSKLDCYSSEFILCWLYSLLKNPFGLDQILKPEERTLLEDFLFEQLNKPCNIPLWKLIGSNIALLLNNILLERKDLDSYEDLVYFNGGCHILQRKVTLQAFYNIICQLSKYGRESSKFIRNFLAFPACKGCVGSMSACDSVLSLRYQVKILSHSSSPETAKNDFEKFVTFINHENSRFGWTISKSIFRVSKYLNQDLVIECLISSLGRGILGEEQAWINVLGVLSLFIQNGADLKNIAFIVKMMEYDEEFVPKSGTVRETGLFFILTIIRTGKYKQYPIMESIIYRIVLMCLFDSSFQCRMAALAVLREYLDKENLPTECSSRECLYNGEPHSSPVFLFGESIKLIDKIEQSVVKRIDDGLCIFSGLNRKELYEEHVLGMLYHYSHEKRECAAKLIVEFYSSQKNICTRYGTPIEADGWNLVVAFNNAKIIQESEGPINGKYMYISLEFDCQRMFKLRNGEHAIESYLKIYKYVNRECLKRNILFLVGKDSPHLNLLSNAVMFLSEEKEFSERIFGMIKKNCCGLFCNASNKAYSEGFLEVCEDNLKKKREPAGTIRALRRFVKNNNYICTGNLYNLVYDHLYDYSIDFTGDVGYFARKESLFFFIDSCSEENSFISDLLIYFMADKSKKLRDEILLCFLADCFSEFTNDFTYLSHRAALYEGKSGLSKSILCSWGIYDKLKMFFEYHSKLVCDMSPENAYFTAIFTIFGLENDINFAMGIVNTAVISSHSLLSLILKYVEERPSFYVNVAMSIIKMPRMPKTAALRFLLLVVQHFKNTGIDVVIQESFQMNNCGDFRERLAICGNMGPKDQALYDKLMKKIFCGEQAACSL